MLYFGFKNFVAGIVAVAVSVSSALAGTITIELVGSVYLIDDFRIDIPTFSITDIDIYDPSTGPIEVGDSVRILLTFDEGQTGVTDDPATVYGAVQTVQVGGFTLENAPADVSITNDLTTTVQILDTLNVLSTSTPTSPIGGIASHAELGGLPLSNILYSLDNVTGTAFGDELLTVDKFLASLYTRMIGSLAFEDLIDENTIDVLSFAFSFDRITVLDASEVPAPAAMPLFVLGASGLLTFWRRRRLRQ